MSSEKENKEYLDISVRPILEKLIPDLLFDKPKDLFGYVKKWLDSNESFLISYKSNFYAKKKNYSITDL